MKEEDRGNLIQQFEDLGTMTFRLHEDREDFDVVMEYVRTHSIPTYTNIDKTERTITISVRPLGPLEMI